MCFSIIQNKGIVPLIFLFSGLFYLFSSFEYIVPTEHQSFSRKKENTDIILKLFNILGFVLSALFFILGYYVFWK